MAKINPYLDPGAHGKLNNSLCFRRYRDTVVLQGLPVPRGPATVKQIEQRNKMVAAREGFKVLPYESREYLNKRSVRERLTPSNIYTRAHMIDQLPSEIPGIPMKKVISMTLFEPVGVIPEHIKLTLMDLGLDLNCNLWSKLNERVGDEVPSMIGPNGQVTGDLQFSPVKFDNGVCYKIPSHGQNVDFISYGLLPPKNEGIIEFQLKLMFPIVNGKPIPGDAFVPIAGVKGENRNYVYFQFHGAAGTLLTYFGDDYYRQIANTSINLDAESVHHFILAWSKSGSLPGNKTLAIFLDGIEVESGDDTLYDNTKGIHLQIPQRVYVDTEGYVDNIRTYPSVEHLQDIINNRNNEDLPVQKNYGYVYDKNNQYVFENEVLLQGAQALRVQLVGPEPVKIPFRYPISIKWEDNGSWEHTSIIRLPEMILEPGADIYFYLSTDFSAYWDADLWRLAGTDVM